MGLLDGKVAVITGGARGQGRAHAVACAREGADVALVDVAHDVARSTKYPLARAEDMAHTAALVQEHGRRAVTYTADVRDSGALGSMVRDTIVELGKIDILIANAGIWAGAPVWEIDDGDWEEMVAINLTGVWKSAKAVIPHMIERQTGSIVVTSSSNGLEPGLNYAAYVSAKHGVIGLARNLALELAPHGIRCNTICPGAVSTPMMQQPDKFEEMLGHPNPTEQEVAMIGYGYHALKGAGFQNPASIADAAVFLNSDLARAITGATLPVDAGHTLLTGINLAPVL